MNLIVATDHQIQKSLDGRYWSQTTYGTSFWLRYLEVFETLGIVARVKSCDKPMQHWQEIKDPRISIFDLPHFTGPLGYLLTFFRIKNSIASICMQNKSSAYILRIPSTIGMVTFKILKMLKIPFGVEVIGDPWDSLSPGTTRNLIRPLLRIMLFNMQKRICKAAQASLYVTQFRLQLRYPPSKDSYTDHASSIELNEADIRDAADLKKTTLANTYRIACAGTFAHLYKGQDVLLRALKILLDRGRVVSVDLIGEGKYRHNIEKLAEDLGVTGAVHFTGQLPRKSLLEHLDKVDLFVLPSRQEGLPRAIIEAMARGVPCVATNVGGIPELIESSMLVEPENHRQLADTIDILIGDPELRLRLALEGIKNSKEYNHNNLTKRRSKFYQYLLSSTRDRQGSASVFE